MAKVNVAGVIFAVITLFILAIILFIFIKMALHRASNRTTYLLKYTIEPPNRTLLLYFHLIDAWIWMLQLYVITIAFVAKSDLSDLCNAAYKSLGDGCEIEDESTRSHDYIIDKECIFARDARREACGQHKECDMTLSGQYNLETSWTCDGPSCQCSSAQIFFAIPMLMIVTFGVSVLFDLGKIVASYKYFWEYLEIKDSNYFCIAFVSDAPCLDCCTCCCNRKSYEAIINFYWYKRKYFRYNPLTVIYIIVRYVVFFVSTFIMSGIINGLKTYKTDTILAWYDFLPLFALWIVNEFVIKLRYKCIAPYTKREHVVYILSMVAKIDEYNIVRIISDYMGPDELVDYKIQFPDDESVSLKNLYEI